MRLGLLTTAAAALATASRLFAGGDKIVEVSGQVEFQPAGAQESTKAHAGTILHSADVVSVGHDEKSKANLVVDGAPIVLGPGETYTVPAAGEPSGSATTLAWLASKLRSMSDNEDILSSPGGSAFRSIALANGVSLDAPINTRLLDGHPMFRWTGPRSKQGLTYELRLKKDGEVIWDSATRLTWAQYPSDAPAMTPGETYFWTVAIVGEPQGELEEVFIQPATVAQAQNLARDEEAARRSGRARGPAYVAFCVGAASEAAGFLDEARTHYEEASRISPATGLYTKALKDLDMHAGRAHR